MKTTRQLDELRQNRRLERINRELRSRQTRISVFVLTLLILARYQQPQPQNKSNYSGLYLLPQPKPQSNGNYNGLDLVDKGGNIRKPADFRDRYQAGHLLSRWRDDPASENSPTRR